MTGSLWDDVFDYMIATLPSSARVYIGVLSAWVEWCVAEKTDALDIRPPHVVRYLQRCDVSYGSLQLRATVFRSAARCLYELTGDMHYELVYRQLRMMRVPRPREQMPMREKHALNPSQVTLVLDCWNGNTPIQQRNRALMAVLFFVGLRRAEAAALKWEDIDLADGTITIRHGKGDKERVATIAGNAGIEALRTWREANTGEIVFPAAWKDGRMRADESMTGDAVYRIVRQTEQLTGIEFRPHDARRTLITEALATGTPLADVQAQAGHTTPIGTLEYALPADAKERGRRISLRY